MAVNIQNQIVQGLEVILNHSRQNWLVAEQIDALFIRRLEFTRSTTNPPLNTEGLYFYEIRNFVDDDPDWNRVNGNRRTQSSRKVDGDARYNFTKATKNVGANVFERRTHRGTGYGDYCLVHYRLVPGVAGVEGDENV